MIIKPKTIAAIAFTIAFTAQAQAQTPPLIPQQLHNPQICAKSDVACIETAYAEYKAALLSEVEKWKQLEIRISKLVASHDEYAAADLHGEFKRRGLFVHFSWMFPTNDQILLTKIPFGEYDALLADCRSAIITLKYLTISLGHNDQQDQQYYRESMNRCEKQFHLEPVLGGFGRSNLAIAGSEGAQAQASKVEAIVETIGKQAERLSEAARKENHDPREFRERVKHIEAATDELRAALVKKVGKEAEAEEEIPAATIIKEHTLLCTDPLRLIFQDEKKLKTHVDAGEIETDDFSTADTATDIKDAANLFLTDLKNPKGKDCSQNWAVKLLESK